MFTADCNTETQLQRGSMDCRRIQVFVATLLMVMSLANGVRGYDEVCMDKVWDCDNQVSREASVVSRISRQKPFNITAALSQCQAVEEAMQSCETEVHSVCSRLTGLVNTTFRGMKNAVRSVCGLGILCDYVVDGCRPNRSVITEITDAGHQRPPDVQLVKEKCSVLNETVAPCVKTLKASCGNENSGKNAISSMTGTFDNLCGRGAMCRSQAFQCSLGASGFTEIGEAMRQRPPNVKLVMEKCRALNASVMQCVHQLQADCRDESSVRSSLTSLASGYNSLCGKSPLCQLKMHRCQLMARYHTFKEGEDRHAQACRHQKEIHGCLLTELDAQCRSLPEIKPVVDAHQSSLASMDCPSGGKRVVENSILLLVLAVITAWAILPSL